MKILIETIPHEKHRYETVGDWFFTDEKGVIVPAGTIKANTLHIRVSQLSDWRREALIAVHELAEVLMCQHDGVTAETVDKFDKEFEENRQPDNEEEPGDDPSAPYVQQHCIATGIERILAAHLGVQWKNYEQELTDLPEINPS